MYVDVELVFKCLYRICIMACVYITQYIVPLTLVDGYYFGLRQREKKGDLVALFGNTFVWLAKRNTHYYFFFGCVDDCVLIFHSFFCV